MKKTPEQIIKEYTRYVQTIAMRMCKPQYYDDMVSIGHLAAIEAYQRLDESKIKNDEKSYLTTCIKGSIMNFLTNNSRVIKIPAYAQKEVTLPTLSTNSPVGDEGTILEDFLVASDDYIPVESNEALKTALLKLKPKYQQIINMYYNLADDGKPMTFKEIGDVLGITKEGVRVQFNLAMNKLKIIMGVQEPKERKKYTWK